jgi:hypothetical protein
MAMHNTYAVSTLGNACNSYIIMRGRVSGLYFETPLHSVDCLTLSLTRNIQLSYGDSPRQPTTLIDGKQVEAASSAKLLFCPLVVV